MRLSELARTLGGTLTGADAAVSGITHDARRVVPGDVYAAIRGARFDGHAFAAQAAKAGAVAVLGEGGDSAGLPYLQVGHARHALADAAALLHGHPSRELRVVGVTGTDGKTTTAWLATWLLRQTMPTLLLGTNGFQLPDGQTQKLPVHFTTPEAPELQALLRRGVQAGARAAVLEASSHSLALSRVRGVAFDVGVWTHITREHLDFHGTVEHYFAAKRRLIEVADFAVLNADDPRTGELCTLGPHATYALHAEADYRALRLQQEAHGIRFVLRHAGREHPAFLPMLGEYNVENALGALAAAHHLGGALKDLLAALERFPGVPGRMQLVPPPGGRGPRVVVDFAHTPTGMEKALAALRQTTAGRLAVVLGATGGLRDPGKRAPLGEVSTRLADYAYFTEEDCGDTPLEEILAEMRRGAAGRDNYRVIEDRAAAIEAAIAEAGADDTVLLASKGHEDFLTRPGGAIPWNEQEIAAGALARWRG